MNFQQKVAEKLGLNAQAAEDQILAALPAKPGEIAALQAALPSIAEALGLEQNADAPAVLAAARIAGQDAKTTVPALQSQVAELSTALKAIQVADKKTKAEAFVDGAIREGRMSLNQANRDEFVAMHIENAERTEKIINGFAVNRTSHTAALPPQAVALASSTDDIVGKAKALQAAEKAKGVDLNWTDAVLKVSEADQ